MRVGRAREEEKRRNRKREVKEEEREKDDRNKRHKEKGKKTNVLFKCTQMWVFCGLPDKHATLSPALSIYRLISPSIYLSIYLSIQQCAYQYLTHHHKYYEPAAQTCIKLYRNVYIYIQRPYISKDYVPLCITRSASGERHHIYMVM